MSRNNFNPYRARLRRRAKAPSVEANPPPVGYMSAAKIGAAVGFKNSKGISSYVQPQVYEAIAMLGYGHMAGAKLIPNERGRALIKTRPFVKDDGTVSEARYFAESLVEEIRAVKEKVEAARANRPARGGNVYREGFDSTSGIAKLTEIHQFTLMAILEKLGHVVRVQGKFMPSRKSVQSGHAYPMVSDEENAKRRAEGKPENQWYAWSVNFVKVEVAAHLMQNPNDKNLGIEE